MKNRTLVLLLVGLFLGFGLEKYLDYRANAKIAEYFATHESAVFADYKRILKESAVENRPFYWLAHLLFYGSALAGAALRVREQLAIIRRTAAEKPKASG